MRLPTDKLIALVGDKKLNFEAGGTQRLCGRIPLSLTATVARFIEGAAEKEHVADLTDVSILGIGFLTDCRLFTGESCIVRIIRDGKSVLIVQCIVKRCAINKDKTFHIGAEYIRAIDSLEPLVATSSNSFDDRANDHQ